MCKECKILDQILGFIDKKIEACGSFKAGPEGEAQRTVKENKMKIQDDI